MKSLEAPGISQSLDPDELRKAKNREKSKRHREKLKKDPERLAQARQKLNEWRANNRARVRASRNAYGERNAEKLAAKRKERLAADGDAIRAKRREYTKAEKSRETRAAYRRKPETRARRLMRESTPQARARQKEKNDRMRKERPEILRAARKRWQKFNYAYTRAACRRYSAKKRGAIGSHTEQEWQNMVAAFESRCAYCQGVDTLQRDHIVPLTRGGTEFITNILPACRSCNSSKHNRIMPDQLADWIVGRRAWRSALGTQELKHAG